MAYQLLVFISSALISVFAGAFSMFVFHFMLYDRAITYPGFSFSNHFIGARQLQPIEFILWFAFLPACIVFVSCFSALQYFRGLR